MCFSASASFGAGIVLSVIGVASIKKVQHPSQFAFAAIPFLFAIQQIAEGILWITLPNIAYASLSHAMTYVFLFFAQFFWPFWVPIAILILDRKDKRNKIQKLLVVMGTLVSIYFAYCLLFYHVHAQIIGHHVTYSVDYPDPLNGYGAIFYFLSIVAPPFFSHVKRMWVFGTIIFISYAITAIFYDHYMLSVWCFFASIISMTIYAIMLEIIKMNKITIAIDKPLPE
jgi:hypothetical protein